MTTRLYSYDKHPDEVLDLHLDWSNRLGDATISAAVSAVDGGDGALTTVDSNTTTVHTVRLSGGTNGETYNVESKVTLSDSQVRVWELNVRVIDKR